METIRPQITYSPDGILEVITGLKDSYDFATEDDQKTKELFKKFRLEQLDRLSEYSGADVRLLDDADTAVLRFPAEQALHTHFTNTGDPEISKFLELLDGLLPLNPRDNFDRVVGLELLNRRGAGGVTYEHMQRWLNSSSLTEDQAKECLKAMALPIMSAKDLKEFVDIEKDFRFYEHPHSVTAEARSIFEIQIKRSHFTLEQFDPNDVASYERRGKALWGNLEMRTLGDCACWGVSGENRSHVYIQKDNPQRLYEMSPHNIDTARQSLSLVLGIGALAYYAVQYTGTEDIYADVEWREHR